MFWQHPPTSSRGQRKVLRILAQGDSWFRYQLGFGVVQQLCWKLRGDIRVRNIAVSGACFEDMMRGAAASQFEAALRTGLEGRPWDAVLFSGGGNDICGDRFRDWLLPYASQNDPEDAIDRIAWQRKLEDIEMLFSSLGRLTARHCPDATVLINLYDFAIPSGRGAGPAGPWLAPAFDARRYPRDLDFRGAIVRFMLREFAEAIRAVAVLFPRLQPLPTQGVLRRQDWGNELHPTFTGFGKLADIFADHLSAVPARSAE